MESSVRQVHLNPEKENVYDLVPASSVPSERKVGCSRSAYKSNADGSANGQVVVRGWGQVISVDDRITFSSVCRPQSTCVVLDIAAEMDYEVLRLSVNTAFINTDVEEDLHVKMVPAYEEKNRCIISLVIKILKRSLYRACQSKTWHYNIDTFIDEIGFKPLKYDPCVYVYTLDDKVSAAVSADMESVPTSASEDPPTCASIRSPARRAACTTLS